MIILSIPILLLSGISGAQPATQLPIPIQTAANAAPSAPAANLAPVKIPGADKAAATSLEKFDQALDRAEQLQLPLNKAILYREAATALIPTDPGRAVSLLKQALSDIDAYEASLKAQGALDDRTFQQLEFGRMPVIMLMERIDPQEALNALAAPQVADLDSAFWTMFFDRLANARSVAMVRDAALRKLAYGASPAVVAAYGVLRKRSPEEARTLATSIVMRLSNSDPKHDLAAVRSAFAMLRLLRTDVGAMAPAMVIDPDALSPESLRDLFSFVGDALLASDDPESLIMAQRPSLYVAALEQYAPDRAEQVKQLPFAAPDAVSEIFAQEKPVYDANHPDPATLKPEQIQQRAAMKASLEAQFKESNAQIELLIAKANSSSLTQRERDDAAFAVVDEANKAISTARACAAVLDREGFRNGELEFYSFGPITNVILNVSTFLQEYAAGHPKIAEEAAQTLDGSEVQARVGLQVAIKELTGKGAYLVPQPKPPAKDAHSAAPQAKPTSPQPSSAAVQPTGK